MKNKLIRYVVSSTKLTLSLSIGIAIGWFAHDKQQPQLIPSIATYNEPVSAYPSATDAVAQIKNPEINSGSLKLLSSLLKQHKFEDVMMLFEVWQENGNSTQLSAANKKILQFSYELISQKNYTSAKLLLSSYLKVFDRNVSARILLAEVYNYQMEYQAAIDALYLAKGHAFRQNDIDAINKKLRSVVNRHTNNLKKNNSYHDLLTLYEKLIQQEADYAPYFIGLAEAQVTLDDFDAAKNSLQMILQDINVGQRANVMLAELIKKYPPPSPDSTVNEEDDETESVSAVTLFKTGSHYLLNAYPNGGEALRLLIDTGASLTVFTTAALKKHNIQYVDTGEVRHFSTANGIIEAPIYQLDHLIIGEWRVDDISIAVLDMPGSNSSEGLLGMNFLQNFRFFIDQKNKLLYLTSRN